MKKIRKNKELFELFQNNKFKNKNIDYIQMLIDRYRSIVNPVFKLGSYDFNINISYQFLDSRDIRTIKLLVESFEKEINRVYDDIKKRYYQDILDWGNQYKSPRWNLENLYAMADYISTISQEEFNISAPLNYDIKHIKDVKVKDVIGHCVIIDDQFNSFLTQNNFDFHRWCENFTGLSIHCPEWIWCFGSQWANTDNTPMGAAIRILWLIECGLPNNWEAQMNNQAPLCYEQFYDI
jgi:hypothetical protein